MALYAGNTHFLPASKLKTALRSQRGQAAAKVVTLTHPQGLPIVSRSTLYDAIAATFPLNPLPTAKERATHFVGGLIDSLYGGIGSLNHDHLIVVWPDTDRVGQASIATLIQGVEILSHALWTYTEGWAEDGRTVVAQLVLVYNDRLRWD